MELVRVLYRLARGGASGVLSVRVPGQRPDVLVLRRGQLITPATDIGGRIASARLARLVAEPGATAGFEGGTAACPPGAPGDLPVVAWVRHHLASQLDASRAAQLAHELAGARLVLRPELAPDRDACDLADRRILEALDQPRRLDQIGALARTSRFRLLCFLY